MNFCFLFLRFNKPVLLRGNWVNYYSTLTGQKNSSQDGKRKISGFPSLFPICCRYLPAIPVLSPGAPSAFKQCEKLVR